MSGESTVNGPSEGSAPRPTSVTLPESRARACSRANLHVSLAGTHGAAGGEVIVRDGGVVFARGEAVESLRAGAPLTLCIGCSGEPPSTAAARAENAARLRRERPEVVEAAFEGIHDLVAASRFAVHAGDRRALGRLMNLNQTWLRDLALSTPAIDRLCRLACEHGAFGAKLTGAGEEGSVVALVNGGHGAWQVLHAWRGAGFEGFVTRVAPAHSMVDLGEAAAGTVALK